MASRVRSFAPPRWTARRGQQPLPKERRSRRRRQALAAAGVRRYAYFGVGPAEPGASVAPVYHYLRLQVTPDQIRIAPVGLRAVDGDYQRLEPVAVDYYPDLSVSGRSHVRRLRQLVIARGATVRAEWE